MDKELKIKKSWDEIPIGGYVNLLSVDKSEYSDIIDKGVFMVDTVYNIDSLNIPYNDFITLLHSLDFMGERPKVGKPQSSYTLNGTKYDVDLNYTNLTTSQFIDLTNYERDNDFIGILSVVLIPTGHTYMDGYDIEQAKDDIADNLSVTDALAITGFFRTASVSLLAHSLRYLQWRMRRRTKTPAEKEKLRKMKELTKRLEQTMDYCLTL